MAFTKEQRRSLVAQIITGNSAFDGGTLESLTDNQLVALADPQKLDLVVNAAAKAAMEDDEVVPNKGKKYNMEDEDEDDEDDDEVPSKPAKGKVPPQFAKTQAANQAWWNSAPPEVQRLVANAQRVEKQRRAQLIESITANGSCPLSPEVLAKRSTEDLEVFAKMASTQVANSSVMPDFGFDFSGLGEPTVNANVAAAKPLGLPSADYMKQG